jgi:pimeloyl-ACP methyl ester carboxylesterase
MSNGHRHAVLRLAVIVLLLAAGRATLTQKLPAGPQVLTFFSDVDDSEQPYALYLPKAYNPARRCPLVVSLHGAGSNHRLNLRRVFGKGNLPGETDVEATRYFPPLPDVNFIVASPLARGTIGYQGIAEKDVYDVLADVRRRFPIDEDRVYLTGLSMGGGGTLWIALTRPDIWAAIAPVCPAPPGRSEDLAGNALNIPVHIFQGGDDPTVKPDGTRQWVKRLQDLGTKVEYTEYPGVKHNSWDNAYKDGAIFDWFAKFRRTRSPDRVRFATSRYKYSSAYWVTIDQLTPGTVASIDATFTALNRLQITTSNLGAFTLQLGGHPKFRAGRALEMTIDGTALKVSATATVSLCQRDKAWAAQKCAPDAGCKRPGAEGPISEALASRHLYVYGTGGNPSQEELRARHEQAARAADWSSPSARPLLSFRVVADRDVRQSDLDSSNLVLFGTRQTNGLIEKFRDRLPIELDDMAAGYGLVYVFPIGDHYIVVSSGLQWWTPPPTPPVTAAPGAATPPAVSRRLRGRFMPGPAGALSGFEDFVLFKDSLETVIAEGRFDRDWRVPAADAEKMKASGAVTIRQEQPPTRPH